MPRNHGRNTVLIATIRTIGRTSLLALAALLCAPALAQNPGTPSSEEIVRQLTPPVQPRAISRSIGSRGVAIEGSREQAPASPSIDLAVNFEYASAKLTPDARIVLDNLGRALTDPALRDSKFRIAGHTDARGSDSYNLALSKQRAQSVSEYLMRQHGIESKRLTVEGFGRSRLLDAANPESAVNRRVQVTNLGS
jgi:OOP family OmpA-OmpF porin